LLAKPQSVSGIAELIGSGQTAKLGHLCVSVEADAIGPGLTVVGLDAVHVGHGVKAVERTTGKPRRAGVEKEGHPLPICIVGTELGWRKTLPTLSLPS
jgi:hypothetical protein